MGEQSRGVRLEVGVHVGSKAVGIIDKVTEKV